MRLSIRDRLAPVSLGAANHIRPERVKTKRPALPSDSHGQSRIAGDGAEPLQRVVQDLLVARKAILPSQQAVLVLAESVVGQKVQFRNPQGDNALQDGTDILGRVVEFRNHRNAEGHARRSGRKTFQVGDDQLYVTDSVRPVREGVKTLEIKVAQVGPRRSRPWLGEIPPSARSMRAVHPSGVAATASRNRAWAEMLCSPGS